MGKQEFFTVTVDGGHTNYSAIAEGVEVGNPDAPEEAEAEAKPPRDVAWWNWFDSRASDRVAAQSDSISVELDNWLIASGLVAAWVGVMWSLGTTAFTNQFGPGVVIGLPPFVLGVWLVWEGWRSGRGRGIAAKLSTALESHARAATLADNFKTYSDLMAGHTDRLDRQMQMLSDVMGKTTALRETLDQVRAALVDVETSKGDAKSADLVMVRKALDDQHAAIAKRMAALEQLASGALDQINPALDRVDRVLADHSKTVDAKAQSIVADARKAVEAVRSDMDARATALADETRTVLNEARNTLARVPETATQAAQAEIERIKESDDFLAVVENNGEALAARIAQRIKSEDDMQ